MVTGFAAGRRDTGIPVVEKPFRVDALEQAIGHIMSERNRVNRDEYN